MGLLTVGLEKIRDFWSGLINTLVVGVGTTQETREDTGLENLKHTSILVTSGTASQFYKVRGIITSAQGTGGSSLAEMGWKAGTTVTRVAHSPIGETTNYDIEYETRYFFKGRFE